MKTFHVPEEQLKELLNKKSPDTRWYYNEEYAAAAKDLLERLHKDGNALRIDKHSVSTKTLRLQYYQGAKYLLDNLDPEGKYKALYSKTVCRTFDDYLELHAKAGLKTIEAAPIILWREKLESFFESAKPKDKFVLDVNLTDSEIVWIEEQLAITIKRDEQGNEIPLFYGQITKNKILIIRDDN